MTPCADECKHRMYARCPQCKAEVYGPGVYSFSHGEGGCGNCGHRVEPIIYHGPGPR